MCRTRVERLLPLTLRSCPAGGRSARNSTESPRTWPRDSSHVLNGADQPPGGHLAATPTPSTARNSATR